MVKESSIPFRLWTALFRSPRTWCSKWASWLWRRRLGGRSSRAPRESWAWAAASTCRLRGRTGNIIMCARI
eukprot:7776625-Pyramimonas_sp.AAC.1